MGEEGWRWGRRDGNGEEGWRWGRRDGDGEEGWRWGRRDGDGEGGMEKREEGWRWGRRDGDGGGVLEMGRGDGDGRRDGVGSMGPGGYLYMERQIEREGGYGESERDVGRWRRERERGREGGERGRGREREKAGAREIYVYIEILILILCPEICIYLYTYIPVYLYIYIHIHASISEVNTNTTASERWTSVEHVLKSAAESTIGKTVATTRRDTPHCSEMAAMSVKQRQLKLWQQNTRNATTRADIKRQRNTLLHTMRRKSRDNAEARLDRMASEVERLHDGAKFFRAVREMTRKPVAKLTIHDNSGRTICNAAEINARVTEHFSSQFSDPSVDGLNAFTETLSRLTHRITPAEIKRAIGKLNSGRASGHDDIPAELFKCSADLLAQAIADIFNDALEHHEPLGLGKGVLILMQKPSKPKGPLTSVRPIVLLTTLRKTLSLVVLSRIAPKVDEYLSPSQSGFRRGRSTADVLFGYRWLCAKAQRQRVSIELLGIDLSRAFDIIRRDKLLDILQTFLGESEMRIIRLLLADTSLEPRLSTGECHAFATSIGTPQGDSLSPVLFTVYLEAALRDLRSRLPTRPQTDANLPLDVEYADDTDFISTSRLFLDDIERITPACLAEWSLTINASKTERSSVCRHADRVDEEWRMTRKLGSLLGEAEDVARRKQLANVAFRKLSTVWFRRSRISLPLRLRLYESFVVPVLIYNNHVQDAARGPGPARDPILSGPRDVPKL